ncbi:MAG: hypothetical protein HKO66_05815 [Saprospiraceae bacterium]|nr:hypothetical protein [Bacteroidia bacterium]NNE14765.1 hypothetical protein [Saprospiraceae bacterium]NNL91727.1 hypothetical protein [Saprospiraceae bacterium]
MLFKTFFLVLIFTNVNAQINTLKLNSSSLGIGFYNSSAESNRIGLGINFDISVKGKNNIYSIYAGRAYLININEFIKEILEFNFTYGKEVYLNNFIVAEGHIGVGYTSHKASNTETHSAVGIPIRLKLYVKFGKHFSMGVNPNININTFERVLSGHLIFQHHF